ncbi:hypothetical protein C2S52_016733 [Perilla frutescens var. hirtella]|nr:hypothetical protein C2S52_016733 [Perilla frutescens var. hirtella]
MELFLIVAIILILPTATPAENTWNPTANMNLNPTQAWRSSEYCLRNTSTTCQLNQNYKLTSSGWLNVTAADGPNFCQAGGCADHTRAVLLCLKRVKRDYWFANSATVQDLYDTISNGCNNGGKGNQKF